MTAFYYLLGVLIFVGSILVSIGLHELGHMIPAKAFGGKVTQYFIGFGPTVWSKQVGETEYGVKAIPLGGYVKIVGMLPPGATDLADEVSRDEQGHQVTRIRKSNTGMFTQLISDARAAEWELIGPEDSGRLFYTMRPWKKIVVMAAGPMVNIVIAFLIFAGIFATYGNQSDVEPAPGTPVLTTVSDCVIPYAEQRVQCRGTDPVSPAVEAGLRPGDRITTFNGESVTGWEQLRGLIQRNADGDAVIGYERDGRPLEGATSTTVEARPTDADSEVVREVGFLGVTPEIRNVTGGPLYTLEEMGYMTVDVVRSLATLPQKVWGVGRAIVGLQEREVDSPVSIVGGSRFAGEVVSREAFPVVEKSVFLLSLVAGFNLFIGLFNFIPLLPLDGGHIISAAWEGVRRRLARLRGRPDPGYVDAARLLPIAYVVASCLLVMGVVLIIGDLVVPIQLA
ncbi:MAG: site-2 protease family protein [Nocardioides sp.]|nr:site-2 protease family protein [Nocardioides sp.]